ncbi:TetR-like C-terminal domain-containing protein [Streptomyces sp. DG2A-72]|uniref:TetR-like C-terminal domain-containing protein n=1 Tax=Streptomyces sp. DG2A-72 TaxID=3051386 RepID=UPI00265BB4E2|nr:TetR-like C-terminal domain-containing protein [Streptomyces sp. DG2A-72]MDO0939036.1 TetR-like C-terminal domain-containing protein [Streptomyces sp. DG2A-72]
MERAASPLFRQSCVRFLGDITRRLNRAVGSVEAEVRARYQAQVIAPRRRRLRGILEQAQLLGLIDADADIEVAVTMATGSWYARALAGSPPPPEWPRRTAALLWRSLGGTPPSPPTRSVQRLEDDHGEGGHHQ